MTSSPALPDLPPTKLLHLILTNAPVVIYVIDASGILVKAEGRGLETLETGLCQAIGQSVFDLYRDYPDIVANIRACLHGQATHWHSHLEQATYSNHAFPLRNSSGESAGLLAVATDITELHNALHEKDVLLGEVHHRVKNNLQIIISLLDLQDQALESETASARTVIANTKQRIKSLALIHEQLYQAPSVDQIDLKEYISALLDNLVDAYRLDFQTLTAEVSGESVILDLDRATPCGLIVNELVTNAIQHGFSNLAADNVLSVMIASTRTSVTLTIKDNGCGLPEGFNLEHPSTLGLQLVHVLVNQLGGHLETQSTEGTEFRLTFPLPQADRA